MASVTFRGVVLGDRALLLRWLAAPHVQEWWGEVENEIELIYDDKGEHEPFIAYINSVPIAFIQAWRPSKHPDLPWQHGMTPTTRGIDITIGQAENLGKGFGPLIIKHFAAKLFSKGATRLIIDPDRENTRAVNAYLKAGFTPYDEYKGDVLMELLPEDFDYAAGYAQN